MPEFRNGEASVHYEIVGAGRPLLLIAGTASDGASWGPLLPLLPKRQLILIDNRGSGRTSVEGPIELEQMVDDCAALLDLLGLEKVDVVGHSLGGYLGLSLAARHPEKVGRLVTMGSGAVGAKERLLFRVLSQLYFTVPPAAWFRLLYQWLFSAPYFASEANVAAAVEASTSYAHRQSPGDFARQVAALERAPAMDVSRVQCPVLAIAGRRDLLASPTAVEALHARIKNLTHVTIVTAAHALHWEAPTILADAINQFLGP